MKRSVSLLIALILALGVAGAALAEEPVKVCIVFSGLLGDKSYNDSCMEGAMRAMEDFGCEVKTLEGTEATEWEQNFLFACEEGYDLVICSSSNFEEYMKEHCASGLVAVLRTTKKVG